MESNHPLVQWFYYLIAPGGYFFYCFRLIGFSITGIFRHMPNQYVSDFHVVVAYALAGFCFWIYYKACSVSPGEIN
jgi:palmitoyltransferase